ncbi:MAG: SNF2-related protein [Akkermansiaceae bacterium]
MEITEKWIAKAAGWKANKAGRDLFKQGSVLDSTTKGSVITGTLRAGASPKPTRVTVKIHSETDIDTVCPRMQCRRTGEICAHAVALMLHSISVASPPETTKTRASSSAQKLTPNTSKNTCIPLQIDLPPTFPDSINAGKGGISVKLSRVEDTTISLTDQSLTDWLIHVTGKPSPPILGLRGPQALVFLNKIIGHTRIYAAGKKASIHNNGSRIPMTLTRDDDRINVRLCPSVLEHGIAWHAEDHLYLWDKQHHYLIIHDVAQLWKPRYWQRITDGNPVSLPLTEFLTSLDAQSDLIIWDDDSSLSDIPISTAEPSITLILDGSTQLLSAQIQAHYSSSDTHTHTIGLTQSCDIEFPIPHPSKKNHYLTRNRDAEDLAAGTLMQAGFQITDPRGTWQMNNEDAIIEFLTSTLPDLEHESGWKIKSSQKLNSQKNNIVRITPSFDFKGDQTQSSGQDWLAFDVNFKTDSGKDIPKEVIQRMLASGKRSGTSKNGKRVIISNFDADTVETVLRDTNPKQENGLYYAPKAQAAYLKRLQNHYSNKPLTKPDLSIIKNLPPEIQKTLRPYQEEGIAWLHDRTTHDGAALLADDMGLGKTLQTLSLIHLLKASNSSTPPPAGKRQRVQALVVCPTSLLGNWQAECKKFFPNLNTLILHGPKRKDYFTVAHSADIIITSYALIARDLDFYTNQKFHTLVIDEASLIRNPDTQAAKALRKLHAEHRIALTGTPVENAVRDLWSLFHFLLPGYLGTRKDFQLHYQQPLSNNSADSAIMKRLRMRVEPFMLRRTKAKVAKDLPPKILQTIYCDPSPSQKKTYAQLLRQGAQKVESMGKDQAGAARIQILTVLLRLRQAATDLRLLDSEMDITMDEASGKLVRLLELLREAKEGNHRVLIFSQFTSMLSIIKAALSEAGITYAYLDGATKDRAKEVERFQSPTGPDTFLISLKAGGYGLNLTAADTVIHFDPWWNPAVEAQATDRAYRIGQTKPTTVYKMVTTGTVEEKIIRLQQAKQGLIDSTLGDEDDAPLMQGLSQQEISSLLTQ